MHPIERLRYVARAGDADPGLLAQEAADALGTLGGDARALVPACRRLLEFHPSCAPLWWVCARLLVASDLRQAADLAAQLLYDDPTADEVAAHLPAGAVVVTDCGSIAVAGLSQRPDLSIRLVASASALRYGMRRIDGDVTGYDPVECDDACASSTIVLVEPTAAGPQGVVLDETGAALVDSAVRSSVAVWAVVGEGRLLPLSLLDALTRAVGLGASNPPDDEQEFDPLPRAGRYGKAPRPASGSHCTIPAASIGAVVGPTGAARTTVALGRATCPSPTELLEPSRGVR
ncbi:MAG TPA: hypothetical protein VG368_00110 [Acidimicrobiales bacterium]|nr:hypothetical protein [Acidimicrobiales bacterium]